MIAASSMRPLSLSLLLVLASAAIRKGDLCNVKSSDLVSVGFFGEYAVAGSGCTLDNGDGSSSSSCFCAPQLADDASLSNWTWQCGSQVSFGPKRGKVCPATIPVPFVTDSSSNSGSGTSTLMSSSSALSIPLSCDATVNPTGNAGDEVCGYDNCAGAYGSSGGSAVCACVDLSDHGGGGMQWFCLHSRCGCGPGGRLTLNSTDTATTITSAAAADRGGDIGAVRFASALLFMVVAVMA